MWRARQRILTFLVLPFMLMATIGIHELPYAAHRGEAKRIASPATPSATTQPRLSIPTDITAYAARENGVQAQPSGSSSGAVADPPSAPSAPPSTPTWVSASRSEQHTFYSQALKRTMPP